MVPISHSFITGYFLVSSWHNKYLICHWFKYMKKKKQKQLRYAKSEQQPEGSIDVILEKPSFLERSSDYRDCILQLVILLQNVEIQWILYAFN